VIVAGGTYDEIVVTPDSRDLMGSGMRAAAALRHRAETVHLATAWDSSIAEEASLVAAAVGVSTGTVVERTERVGFRYSTPVSAPAVNGPSASVTEKPLLADSTVLMFGLVEAPTGAFNVDADILVLDPQKPRDTGALVTEGVSSRRLIVVANDTEVRKLGGGSSTMDAAEGLLHKRPDIEAVITKRGAVGSLVTVRNRLGVTHHSVGAHPTTRVWPIGSGDTFSAGVAHALDSGADIVEAARVGSAAAAHWCSTRDPALPRAILSGDLSDVPNAATGDAGQVYLAGPFFTVAQRWLVDTVRDELISLGVDVWSPVHEVGPGGDEVAEKDLDGLRSSDAVLALLDHGDAGTVFEVGWAVRRGIPIVGFATSFDREGAKMLTGTTVEMHRDLSTACYRAAWASMGVPLSAGWVS
jgi:nucleoside 2-deoxyribosyltransferase